MKPLIVHPIQTRIFHNRENLAAFVVESVPRERVQEGLVIAVTSKIVSLAEGRLVARAAIDKKTLIQKEADTFLGEIGHGCLLTIKCGLLVPSAGVDESNSENGDYILYPKDPMVSADELWRQLRKSWGIEKLGVILTDSRTSPLNLGVTGVCLSYAGFRALRDLVGTPDLFGREFRMTQMNFADGMAATAVMVMGEGAESRPLAVIENADVEFVDSRSEDERHPPLRDDLYFPLLRSFCSGLADQGY